MRSPRVPRLFFLLSGEHPSLPFAELDSIFKAEDIGYRPVERLIQVLRAEADSSDIETVASRAAMTRSCALEIFNCDAVFAEIVRNLRSSVLEHYIDPSETFAVRVKRVQGAAAELARVELERKLGDLILNRVDSVKVNLRSPQKVFLGILTQDRFVFGLQRAEIPTKPFFERNPQKRPFFHPTAMSAKLARCMVNLAQPRADEIVLDPFCGTASMLIEAAMMGCRVLGFDVQSKMVKGSSRNLSAFDIEPEGLIVADAKSLPIHAVDCVVTDPPYGRSATTLGWTTQQIIDSFLTRIEEILRTGRRLCIAAPKSVKIGELGSALGLKHVESHLVYVHRSLTREIAVFERI
jgi:tRNA (guanine10-N2)-dimethyltransferase